MSNLAEMFEAALRKNQSKFSRETVVAALRDATPETKLSDLGRDEDVSDALRALTLRDFGQLLEEFVPRTAARRVVESSEVQTEAPDNRDATIYLTILDAASSEPLTIGELAERTDLPADELRDYIQWMIGVGKLEKHGRARGTRYRAAPAP